MTRKRQNEGQPSQGSSAEVSASAQAPAPTPTPIALKQLAQIKTTQGALNEAAALLTQALALSPRDAATYNQLGHVRTRQARLHDALKAYQASVAIEPAQPNTHYNLGNTLWGLGQAKAALAAFALAQQGDPAHAAAWHNAGIVLQATGQIAEAERHFARAVEIRPQSADLLNSLGALYTSTRRFAQAIHTLQLARTHEPAHAGTARLLGDAWLKQQQFAQAKTVLETACQLDPRSATAWAQLGVAHEGLGNTQGALASYERAISLDPHLVEALNNLGNLLKGAGRVTEALALFDRALQLRPDLHATRVQRLHQLSHLCEWERMASDRAYLEALSPKEMAASPFAWLALTDSPQWHKQQAVAYAEQRWGHIAPAPFEHSNLPHKRIHVGYYSADFHNHATMHLMIRLFELHDRSRFCIHIFSYDFAQSDATRTRLQGCVEHFHDVAGQTDAEVCALSRRLHIDIAIDLKGYTGRSRTSMFALRLAPVQCSYLGYPGTSGASFFDYLIADATVAPPDHEQNHTESVISLPDCYQVNDDTRAIAAVGPQRVDEGLPDSGFVFCCFNASFKISTSEFGIWMRLLQQVEGSVLWLIHSNPQAERNLKVQARAFGVDDLRLVFAKKLPLERHLARHRLADLFLDTFACNAHTTASDALWAGLPLLTLQGQSFASRVASSLLTSVGMPELIVSTAQAYELLALELARDSARLLELKDKLEKNRQTKPLFQSARFARHLESAFQEIHHRHAHGWPPRSFGVKALPD